MRIILADYCSSKCRFSAFGFATTIHRGFGGGGPLDSFAGTVASPGRGVLSQVGSIIINSIVIDICSRADTETPSDMLLSYCSDINKDSLYHRFGSDRQHD